MVIFKGKLKSAKGLLVYLAVIIVLYKILNRLNFNFFIIINVIYFSKKLVL